MTSPAVAGARSLAPARPRRAPRHSRPTSCRKLRSPRRRGPGGDYLKTLHAHIHQRWTDNFLRLIGRSCRRRTRSTTPTRAAEADIVVAANGQLISATSPAGPGSPASTTPIIEVLQDAVPYPNPPHRGALGRRQAARPLDRSRAISAAARPSRSAHLRSASRWRCPKLLQAGRRDEALRRVALARSAGLHAEPDLTTLANDWVKAALQRAFRHGARWRGSRRARRRRRHQLAQGRRAEARSGGRRGRRAGRRQGPALPAGQGLSTARTGPTTQPAAGALATAGEAACVPGLIKLLENAKAHPEGARRRRGRAGADERRRRVEEGARRPPPRTSQSAVTAPRCWPRSGPTPAAAR